MKNIYKNLKHLHIVYLFSITIFMITISCNNNVSSVDDKEQLEKKFYSVKGFVSYIFLDLNDSTQRQDTMRTFDNQKIKIYLYNIVNFDSVLIRSNGEFVFDKVKEGSYIILINDKSYNTFTRQINVPPDTNLNILLEPNKDIYCKETFTVRGYVWDQPIEDVSGNYLRGVKVYLDKGLLYSDSTITDGGGGFQFNNVCKGFHSITVDSFGNFYQYYHRKIYVNENFYFLLYIQGKKADYFPFDENTRYKFKYDFWSFSTNGEVSHNEGTSSWNVDSVKYEPNLKTYFVTDTFKTASNTTYRKIIISINQYNRVKIKGLPMVDTVSFNRFQDIRRLEIISVPTHSFEYGVSIKRNVGLYKITRYLNRLSEVYQRIE